MDISHGNCLCSYPYLKLARTGKNMMFIFYLFTSTKSNTSCRRVGGFGLAPVGRGKWWERSRQVNMAQIMYTHVYKCKKMISVEVVPGISGGGIKESGGEGEV
jgi:hypothetical protein